MSATKPPEEKSDIRVVVYLTEAQYLALKRHVGRVPVSTWVRDLVTSQLEGTSHTGESLYQLFCCLADICPVQWDALPMDDRVAWQAVAGEVAP